MKTWDFSGAKLTIQQGDLTALSTDAIVNAANSALAGGGGVDGAIHRAAGHAQLQNVCQAIIADRGRLEPGQAVITPGFQLPAKHIIHTVGPIWRGGTRNEPELLASAYRSCLELAHEHGLASIAFPAISCGVYGYPLEQAMPIALGELAAGLERGLVREASMVLHGAPAYHAWTAAARTLFPNQTQE